MTQQEREAQGTELCILILDLMEAWCADKKITPANPEVHAMLKEVLKSLIDTMPEPEEFKSNEPLDLDKLMN